jgi:ketosteroid isomerase-like protein
MSPVDTVRKMYEAFLRGDIKAILACLAEDVEWEYGGGTTDVPWLQPRQGRAGVADFFETLQGLEFHRFEITKVFGDDNTAVSLLDIEATVKITGKRLTEIDEVHIWHFNPKGEVSRFRHRADTYAQAMAIRP